MQKLTKILLFTVILLKSDSLFSQWVTKSITLPFIECKNEELNFILDSIFEAEKKCDYYSDTLLLGILFIVNPDNENMYSAKFETGNKKRVMFRTGELGVIAYFRYKDHYCLVYNLIPNEIFSSADCEKTFYFKDYIPPDPKNIDPNNILIVDYEDDSFSQWVYYFYDNKFHYYEHYSYCGK